MNNEDISPSIIEGLQVTVGPNWQSAWARFHSLVAGPLLGYLAKHFPVLNHADIQNVLQDTMVKMRKSGVKSYDSSKGGITSLLYTIAHRTGLDALRRKKVQAKYFESLDRPIGDADGPALIDLLVVAPDTDDVEKSDLSALTYEALPLLVKHRFFQQKTADMFADLLKGGSPEDVAAQHATTRGNVDQAKSTVLKRLAKVMGILDAGGLTLEEAVLESK